MSRERLIRLLRPLIRPVTRLELYPVEHPEDLPSLGSHFGGYPYFNPAETWPACGCCRRGMSFVCQLDLSSGYHEKLGDVRLMTFFYCWECSPGGADNDPEIWTIRTYREVDSDRAVVVPPPRGVRTARPCRVSMDEGRSLPASDGLEAWSPEADGLSRKIGAYSDVIQELIGTSDLATVLGGYPHWIQGDGTPECRRCRGPMELAAQIRSEEAASLRWGDVGCAYLFVCRAHPEETQLELQGR